MNQVKVTETKPAAKENELFFRQWLRSPKSMGAVAPSSKILARAVTEAVVWQPGQVVVDLGAGTGAITQGLLEAGLPPKSIVMIELDRPLYDYLRRNFPQCTVLNADATKLAATLKGIGVEQVSTVISGLPMITMPLHLQRAVIEQSFAVLGPKGCLLQYSYMPVAPIPARKLGVEAKLVKFVVRNLPPATVWRFWPAKGNGWAHGTTNGQA